VVHEMNESKRTTTTTNGNVSGTAPTGNGSLSIGYGGAGGAPLTSLASVSSRAYAMGKPAAVIVDEHLRSNRKQIVNF
jgi:hypothetical protein